MKSKVLLIAILFNTSFSYAKDLAVSEFILESITIDFKEIKESIVSIPKHDIGPLPKFTVYSNYAIIYQSKNSNYAFITQSGNNNYTWIYQH